MMALASNGHLASPYLIEDALVRPACVGKLAVEGEVSSLFPAVAHLPSVIAFGAVLASEIMHRLVEHPLAHEFAYGARLGYVAYRAAIGDIESGIGHAAFHVEWQPIVLVGMFDGSFKLRPVAGDAHTALVVTRHDGQGAFARQLVGIGGIKLPSELPCCRLPFGHVDGMGRGLHVVPERA